MSEQSGPESPATALDTELTTPRLQFYLKHKASIETWDALKNDVRKATGDMLEGLLTDLAVVAPELGDDVSVQLDGERTQFPHLVFRRATWPTHEQEAALGIGLEWLAKVEPSGRRPPYYGVRVDLRMPGGKELLEAIRALAQSTGTFPKPYVLTGRDWPVYRYMDGDPDWWTDLPAWRQRVIDEVVGCWRLSVPIVDEIMGQPRYQRTD